MEFRTRLVVGKRNKKAGIAYAGLAIAVLSLGMIFVPVLEGYVAWAFSAGIIVLVAGAIRARGDIATYGLSPEELVVTVDRIVAGGKEYAIGQVRKIDFNVTGYSGMTEKTSAYSLNGLGNELSFLWEGKTVICPFYLNSEKHTLQLRAVFEEFYAAHIPFIERSGSTRTFLFKNLSAAELAEFKNKYGYG
ncbi:MAG TPA: hypothetical protein VK563_03190 [Puia sp.]|nr:hypothetical protein [Puia sp.]